MSAMEARVPSISMRATATTTTTPTAAVSRARCPAGPSSSTTQAVTSITRVAWYAPRGPSFVVVAAPIGVFVPVLPPFYNTVWVGGLPYYYANDTYYEWRDGENGYEVVEPPHDQAVSTQPPPSAAPPGEDLYIYPQNGQPADQQANDKYECHKWASTQTGFDPTQPAGGVPPEQAALKRADYQRAMRACLEGRGYSVR